MVTSKGSVSKKPSLGKLRNLREEGLLDDLWIISDADGHLMSPKYYVNSRAALSVKKTKV